MDVVAWNHKNYVGYYFKKLFVSYIRSLIAAEKFPNIA